MSTGTVMGSNADYNSTDVSLEEYNVINVDFSTENQIDIDVYARGENGVGIASTIIEYQVGTSGKNPPTGSWSSSIVVPQQGQYLWTRITINYTNGNTDTSYNVSYFSKDGGYYTPAVSAAGNLSWTASKSGMPPVTTVNIKGPKGDMGSIKFKYVQSLPTTGIEYDAFYVMDAVSPTSYKLYDEYFYINNHWEKVGDDLTAYYNKIQIDNLLTDQTMASDTTYNITGKKTGSNTFYKTGITYNSGSETAAVNGVQITTGLYFSIE